LPEKTHTNKTIKAPYTLTHWQGEQQQVYYRFYLCVFGCLGWAVGGVFPGFSRGGWSLFTAGH